MVETKAQLAEQVAALNAELHDIQKKLEAATNQLRRVECDKERAQKGARDSELTLHFGRLAIEQCLSTKHGLGVTPLTEWVRGQDVVMEEPSEDVRFLRYLHGLLCRNEVPF